MKKISIAAILTLLLLVPLVSFAENKTVSGVIMGLKCLTRGTSCPADNLDTHIVTENGFVLQTDDGYYFMPNINLIVLAKYATVEARVIGKVSEKYRSIRAESLQVMKEGEYKEVWTRTAQEEAIKRDLMGH